MSLQPNEDNTSSRFIEIYSPISNQRNSLCDAMMTSTISQSYLTSSSSPHSLSSMSASPANQANNSTAASNGGFQQHQNHHRHHRQPLLPAKYFNYYCLRFSDLSTAVYWLNRISALIEKLTVQAIQETNQLFQMVNKTHSFNLKYLGWLDEQVVANGSATMQQFTQSLSFGNSQFNFSQLKVSSKILIYILNKSFILLYN